MSTTTATNSVTINFDSRQTEYTEYGAGAAH
jgi:hypothetical protein